MIAGRRLLGLVPARGGSRGIPGKNLRELAGRPLIAWTLEVAGACRYLDRIVVSSEDAAIRATAIANGADVPFARPAPLAADDTPMIDVVLHALEALAGYDLVVLLQPTSPLRRVEDVEACLERLVETGAPAAVSLTPVGIPPRWMFTLDGARLAPVLPGPPPTRRQDAVPTFALNGAVYAARTEWLLRERTFLTPETVGVVMSAERSVDLDTEEDWIRAEQLFRRRRAPVGEVEIPTPRPSVAVDRPTDAARPARQPAETGEFEPAPDGPALAFESDSGPAGSVPIVNVSRKPTEARDDG